jgi:PDZ domain-containing protein
MEEEPEGPQRMKQPGPMAARPMPGPVPAGWPGPVASPASGRGAAGGRFGGSKTRRGLWFGALLIGVLALGAVGSGLVHVPGMGSGSNSAVVTTTNSDSTTQGVGEDQNQGHRIGVAIQNLTPELVKSLQLQTTRTEGILITGIFPNSGAEEAGLRKGDIVIGADGVPFSNNNQFKTKNMMTPIGQTYQISFERDGVVQTVPIRVVPWCTATEQQCGIAR